MIKQSMVLGVAVCVALSTAKLAAYATGTDAASARAAVPTALAPPTAAVFKARDGHYWAATEVNGRWIRCLVDTGATSVVLTAADAARLGLSPGLLRYDTPLSMAGGQGYAARIELDHVSVAGVRVDHVSALVVREGLPASLLGMSYLGRLSRFEATPTTLILSP